VSRLKGSDCLWDFSGTFSCIKRHEGERRERTFSQVSCLTQ
jgi:hypothetical protein